MAQNTTTNLRLPTEQWRRLKSYALDHGLSFSGLVREAAEAYLAAAEGRKAARANDAFFSIGERPGRSGEAHASERHDAVLYANPGRKPRR